MACIRERRNRLVIDFYDQHGKRRWKTLPENITQRDAKKALRDIENRIEKGSYLAPKKAPNFSKLTQNWLDAKKPDLRQYSHKQYIGYVENYLKPYYGAIQIRHINYDSVERFMQYCRKREISISTLKKIKNTFQAIMHYACKKRYIDHNPVKDIDKPKGQSNHNEDDEMTILSRNEILALIDAAPDLKYKTLFMTAILTGMRQGEILGFKWEDIDWVANQARVRRTYNHGRFYNPKSKTSKRKIDLAPQLITQLKQWQVACPPNKLDLVFPTRNNNPIDGANMVKTKFLPTLKRARIRKVKFHGLRHTFASLYINQGENPKYIQKQLGHSSINITFDIYGHLMKDTNEQAATKLGDNIFGSKSVAESNSKN